MLNKILLFSAILFFNTCTNKHANRKGYYNNVRKLYQSYIFKEDSSKLNDAYKSLKAIEDFQNNGITSENVLLIIPIYMKMRKYKELSTLLKKSDVLPFYENKIILNISKGLQYKCSNQDSSVYFFKKNAAFIKKQMVLMPMDSSKVADYYINQLYLTPLDSVLAQINEEKYKSSFSPYFYDKILKDAVIEYDRERVTHICP